MTMSKEQTDLKLLERARAIPDENIKQTELGYEVLSNDTRNQGEVFYFVSFPSQFPNGHCTCKNFEYHNNEEQPDYVCKHIIKVNDYKIKQLISGGEITKQDYEYMTSGKYHNSVVDLTESETN